MTCLVHVPSTGEYLWEQDLIYGHVASSNLHGHRLGPENIMYIPKVWKVSLSTLCASITNELRNFLFFVFWGFFREFNLYCAPDATT